jgi:alanine-glyoxylate transaminase/serine-glyoxylate transaminase/serine-pyruvate transaminase
MMPAGLAIMAVSQKALAQRGKAGLRRCYFDFDDMIRTNKDGFFPYTPPLHLLRGLRASLDLLFAEGLDNVYARHHRLAEGVRRAVAAWGLRLCAKEPRWHSDTVSAIVIPEGHDSAELVKHAYHRYGLSLGVGLSKVAGRVFRIGHLGDLNELMCLMAIAGSEMAMRDLGIPVEAGSGVAAAEEYYRASGEAALRQAA